MPIDDEDNGAPRSDADGVSERRTSVSELRKKRRPQTKRWRRACDSVGRPTGPDSRRRFRGLSRRIRRWRSSATPSGSLAPNLHIREQYEARTARGRRRRRREEIRRVGDKRRFASRADAARHSPDMARDLSKRSTTLSESAAQHIRDKYEAPECRR